MNAPAVHRQTPGLIVRDPRGLTIRAVSYWRDSALAPVQTRVNRSVIDSVGRVVAEWDPRLVAQPTAPANLTRVYSLGNKVLGSASVDAGWRVNLFAEADQQVHGWDARGNERRIEYDTLLRPVAVFEQAACVERHHYAEAAPHFAVHNQCGQLIRHDNPSGTQHFNEFGITGALLEQHQHFLQSLDMPDWPLPLDGRDDLLEQVAGARSALQFNPLGDVLEQTDARDNRQRFNHTIDGQLREAWLQLKNATAPQRLVHDIHYNAQGQIEQQTAGNKVVSMFDYCPQDGRLTRLRARQPGGEPLQDLNYIYDPVGNILSLEDKAMPVRFFSNQRIEPINRYTYDSLYQLIEATGWEAGSANRGPAHIEDPAAVANYCQVYRYNLGGNLEELTHQGPQQHGRVLTTAKHSNRCLPEVDGRPPTEAEIAEGFDANGNLLMLDRGRTLSWDARNQLSHVHTVERTLRLNDTERYIYGADGMRQRKVRTTQTNARTVVSETRYLPGLETRDVDGEKLHVVTVQTGRSTVQVLHWEGAVPQQLANDQYRYNLSDHLGSCSLELDSEAKVTSRETYHPFGTTAFTQKGNSSEESYRTLRYSSKERDTTGLYYYGQRYYIPWLQRWGSPDPAGVIDGLNFYRMVRNNPINLSDDDGLEPKRKNDEEPSPAKRRKTESRTGLFRKAKGDSPRVRDIHIDSDGDSESEDPDILYRALRADEPDPQTKGLNPPAGHNASITAYEHVAYGTRSRDKSKYISATRSIKVAGAWAAEKNLRVVKFTKSANATTFDLTTASGRQALLKDHRKKTQEELTEKSASKALNFAKGSQEVLIRSHVRGSRIQEVYEAREISDDDYLFMKNAPSQLEDKKIFKTRSKVTVKDPVNRMTLWAKPKAVLLTRIFTRGGP